MSRHRIVIACALALLVAGCSMLPQSLRQQPPGEASGKPAAPAAVAGAGPMPPAAAPATGVKTFSGTGVFVNPKPTPSQAPAGPEEASLNFEGADIREVAKVVLGDYLKESYTVHPAVTGTVTFRTVKPIALKDLLPTLEMLLRQNGAAAVREEGLYKILPITAIRGSLSPQLGGVGAALPRGYSVQVVPLRYVGAREMAHLLEPFAPENTVRVDEVRNLVILAGGEREMRHLLDAIELFDVDFLAGYSVGLFPIKSADVKTLIADLDKVFGAQAQGPLAGIVRVVPIERLNALLVVTTQPKYLETARSWVEKLDTLGGTSGGTRFFVYQVRNGKAENLAGLISDLFASRRTTTPAPTLAPGARPAQISTTTLGTPLAATTPAGQPATAAGSAPAAGATVFNLAGTAGATSSEVRVIADKDTNSLLILAAPADYEIIENALKKLDVIPRQVLVEVLLAEVTLTDDLSLGLEWYVHTRNSTSGQLNLGGLPSTASNITGVPLSVPTFQLVNLAGNEVRAVLNTLGQDGRTQVLASPQIMVLDNQKAQIKVGDRISVQTQAQTGVSTGTGVLNSFQYLETGILLSVTPRINSGGQVTLEVNQEVSVPDPKSVSTTNPNPTVNSRAASTVVVVASGESVVLGGLIREDNTRSSAGIPLLSKIPILGAAFGSQSLSKRRTELVLIITPKIVSDAAQAREVTNELRDKLPALKSLLPPPKGSAPPGGTP
jgi:general secretion pathway protein D